MTTVIKNINGKMIPCKVRQVENLDGSFISLKDGKICTVNKYSTVEVTTSLKDVVIETSCVRSSREELVSFLDDSTQEEFRSRKASLVSKSKEMKVVISNKFGKTHQVFEKTETKVSGIVKSYVYPTMINGVPYFYDGKNFVFVDDAKFDEFNCTFPLEDSESESKMVAEYKEVSRKSLGTFKENYTSVYESSDQMGKRSEDFTYEFEKFLITYESGSTFEIVEQILK